MLQLLAAILVIAAWSVWIAQNQRWTSPLWRSVVAAASLLALTASFAISLWMIASQKGEELFYGTLMRMQPWPRVGASCAAVAILTALIGKKGTRALVVMAALLIEFYMFGIVLTD